MSWTLLKHNLRTNWSIWLEMTLIFFLYFAIMLSMYDPENLEAMEQMIALLPEALVRAMNFDDFGTTLFSFLSGYLYGFLIYLFPMVITVVVNHQLVAAMVDKGSITSILSSPMSRTTFIRTQIVTSLLAMAMFFVVYTSLGVILSEIMFPGDLDVGRFFLLNLHAYALYTVIGGIGFIASTIADDKNVSLSAGIGFPVFFLVMQMLRNADPQLENFKYLSLFTLFDPQLVSTDPTAVWGYIGVLVGLSTLLYSASHLIFTKKNLYV